MQTMIQAFQSVCANDPLTLCAGLAHQELNFQQPRRAVGPVLGTCAWLGCFGGGSMMCGIPGTPTSALRHLLLFRCSNGFRFETSDETNFEILINRNVFCFCSTIDTSTCIPSQKSSHSVRGMRATITSSEDQLLTSNLGPDVPSRIAACKLRLGTG